jgi:hypothetical protein
MVLVLLIATPLILRAKRLSRVPRVDQPFDTKEVLVFVVPDADNAFVEFRSAKSLHVQYAGTPGGTTATDEFEKAQSDGWEHATEPVRKWLEANRPFMEIWRKGTAKPDAQYQQAGEYHAATLLNEVYDAREFARLVRLESSRLLLDGHPDAAWSWLQTSFRMSRQIGRHGSMIERLIGIGAHAITAEAIVKWANDSQVTTPLLKQAIRELRVEQQRAPLFAESVKVEYLSDIATWRSMPDGPLDSAYLAITGESEINERILRHLFAEWLARANELDQKRLGIHDGAAASSTRRRPTTSELNAYIHESAMMALQVPSMSQAFVAVRREAARDRVLLSVLALELFARERGHYPDKLDELVPDVLLEVPEDTHAPPKTPLRYRRDGDEALIYSIGENGLDDGGMFEKVEDIGYRIGKPSVK